MGHACAGALRRALVPLGRALRDVFPTVAAEWHPTKNRPFTPADLLPINGNRKVTLLTGAQNVDV